MAGLTGLRASPIPDSDDIGYQTPSEETDEEVGQHFDKKLAEATAEVSMQGSPPPAMPEPEAKEPEILRGSLVPFFSCHPVH